MTKVPVILFYLFSQCLALQTEPEEVTLDGLYGFFTNEIVIKRFYVTIVLQFLFIAVGYLVSHEIWRIFIDPDIDTDPKFDELANFLLTDQIAAGGVGISVAYGIASSLLWIGLSQLGNPLSTKKRNFDSDKSVSSSGWLQVPGDNFDRQVEEKKEISIIDDILPSVMTRNGVLNLILVQGVLSASFLSFWYVMEIISNLT